MKVQDIMTTDVKFCGPEANLAALCDVMFNNDCGILPVVDEAGKVTGVITDRDICIALGTKQRLASDVTTREVISGKVFACAPDDDIGTALETMRKARVRRLPVVDGEGRIRGLLSMNDVVLSAEKESGKKAPGLSYEDVVKTYSAICEHSIAAPQEQQQMEQTARA